MPLAFTHSAGRKRVTGRREHASQGKETADLLNSNFFLSAFLQILSQISHFIVSHNEFITRKVVVFAVHERHVLTHRQTGCVDTGTKEEASCPPLSSLSLSPSE